MGGSDSRVLATFHSRFEGGRHARRVGAGSVVTLGSQIAFRTQTRGTFKLLFNAIFQGPAETLSAAELARLD